MKSMKPFVSFPPLVIRPASPDDAALLRLIYAPYIQETAITFEKTVTLFKGISRADRPYPSAISLPCL